MGLFKKDDPKKSKLDPKPIGGLNRGWGTAGAGWVDVDPSGNRMNRKAAKKDDKEEAKWETMSADEYRKRFVKGREKNYGVERDGRNFRVKTRR